MARGFCLAFALIITWLRRIAYFGRKQRSATSRVTRLVCSAVVGIADGLHLESKNRPLDVLNGSGPAGCPTFEPAGLLCRNFSILIISIPKAHANPIGTPDSVIEGRIGLQARTANRRHHRWGLVEQILDLAE